MGEFPSMVFIFSTRVWGKVTEGKRKIGCRFEEKKKRMTRLAGKRENERSKKV